MKTLVTSIQELSASFQRAGDATSETALRDVRLELASTWAGAEPTNHARMAQGELLYAWAALRASGLQDFGLSGREVALLEGWLPRLHGDWPSPASHGLWLACSLFLSSCELGLQPRFDAVPAWLRDGYLQHVFESPRIILNPGASADYAAHIETALQALLDAHCGQSTEEFVLPRLNLVQAYFNDTNLKGLMKNRARLLERILTRRGLELDYDFPRHEQPRQRPRIGILAFALAPHTESYFALSHLQGLDRALFEIRLYTIDATENPVLDTCRSLADSVTVLPTDLAMQAQTIRNDDIDLLLILTNIGAVTNHISLLAAHRLARVQVASMSTPVTTGYTHIGHFLSAEHNESANAQDHYSERLWLTAGSLNHYAFSEEAPENPPPTRSRLGIPADAMVYFSAANYFKIVPELSQLWVRILSEVPSSYLVLLPFNGNWASDYPSRAFRQRLLQELSSAGVDPSRLVLHPPVPTRGDVAALMCLADVYLDGYPFAGACSLFDPLSVALPTVVRDGVMARSRHGSAILRMFGLDELIAHDEADYARIAVELAKHPPQRDSVRHRIRDVLARGNPILDSSDFGTALGSVFKQMLAAEPTEPAPHIEVEAQLSAFPDFSGRLAERRTRILSDTELVRNVILPTFDRSTPDQHIVDVGACYGEVSAMFLERGWTADLFEPDPACRDVIQARLSSFRDRMRLHPVAVGDRHVDSAQFFKAATNGLSGLTPSPYGATKAVLQVPIVKLASYLPNIGVKKVDFLKVDTEGQDLHVLASHDFSVLAPRYVLIEVNTVFEDQSLDQIRATLVAMRGKGYESLLLRYEDDGTFKQGVWDRYWLRDILTTEGLPTAPQPFFANVVFFRPSDAQFIRRLTDRVEQALQQAA